MKLFDSKTKLLFILSFVLVVFLIFIILQLFIRPSDNGENVRPDENTITRQFTPLQRSVITRTTDKEVAARSDIISTSDTPDGGKKYQLRSVSPLITDEIKTKNGVVVFEKTNTQTYQFGDLQKVQSYIDRFGQPEATIDNIAPYGWEATSYIYASKGFTLIANRFTESIYEVQRFVPLTVDEYKKQYPALLQNAPGSRETHEDAGYGENL